MASFVPIRAFYCFDPTDRALCESLDRHLAPLKHAGRLQTWDERHILVGQEWEREYDLQFSTARLLILLVSSEFLASERGLRYLQMALDRQQAREATVVPILVRSCLWEQTALSTMQMLPRDHRALAQQANRDATWTEIVQEISRVLASLHRLIYLIYAPEDHERGARLSQEMIRVGVTPWHVEGDHLSPDLLLEREAMRQASSVLLVASPAALSSRVVRDQKDLADVYKRPIQLVWMRDEGETEGIWQQEARFAAPAENDAMTSETLLTHLPQVLEMAPEQEQSPHSVTEPRNPYKGLHHFTAEDTRDFFGREALVDELAETVERLLVQEQKGQPMGRLLTVLGASGSGKSSVVLAGLLPCLKHGDLSGSGRWLYLDPIVPGAHPLEALALSLAQQPSLGNASSLHHELMADSLRTLHLLTRQLVGSSSQNAVLFIDQFEEVFTTRVSEEERQHFFDLLITAATEPEGPLLVMVTMRADFFDRAMRYPALYRLLDTHRVTVLPMEREELRRVIEEPAHLPEVQMTFEGDLVGDLLFELRGQVGALPLLEFTLDQLFASRSGQLFTVSAYQEMGGVKGALASHAQATYDALPTKGHQELARSLFLRLIDPGHSEQATTRRRAKLSEFELPDLTQTQLLRETMDAFLDARLLTSNKQTGVATIEVSHEALIREWPRLIAWLREAREDIHSQQALSEDVAEWIRRGRPTDRLYRGSQLAEIQEWVLRNMPSQNEAVFLQASVAEEEQKKRQEHEREKRELILQRRVVSRQRSLVIALSLFSVVMIVVTLVANAFRLQAEREATSALLQAKISLSHALSANARFALSQNELDQALLLSDKALQTDNNYEARSSLLQALQYSPHINTMLHTDPPNSIEKLNFTSLKDIFISLSGSDVYVWDVSTKAYHSWPLISQTYDGDIISVESSPTDPILATAGEAGVWLWDIRTGRQIARLEGKINNLPADALPFTSLTWSRDGKMLAFSRCKKYSDPDNCATSQISLWNIVSKQQNSSPQLVPGEVESIALSPDHQTLAYTSNFQVHLWNVTTKQSMGILDGISSAYLVTFSPDGKTLAIANYGGTIQLWDIPSRSAVDSPFTGHTGLVTSIAFSPDGQILASSSNDTTVRLWDVALGRSVAPPLTGDPVQVNTVAFSQDGKTLLSGDDSGTIMVWNTATGNSPISHSYIYKGAVQSAVFSSDGKTLFLGNEYGQILLQDSQTGKQIDILDTTRFYPVRNLKHGLDEDLRTIQSLALSRDGRTLASGRLDGTVILWNMETKTPFAQFALPNRLQKIMLSADGQTVAASGDGHAFVLWSVKKGAEIPLSLTHQFPVSAFALSPDGRFLAAFRCSAKENASVCDASQIILWDILADRLINTPPVQREEYVTDLAFSPDGRTLAWIDAFEGIFLWDISTGKSVGHMLFNPSENNASGCYDKVTFDPSGQLLVSYGSSSPCFILWDETQDEPFVQSITLSNYGNLNNVAFSPDGQQFATIGVTGEQSVGGSGGSIDPHEGVVTIWNIALGSWEQSACTIANRNLTEQEWNQFVDRDSSSYSSVCPLLPAPGAITDSLLEQLKQANTAAQTDHGQEAAGLYKKLTDEAIQLNDADFNNTVCWEGSVHQFAQLVFPTCERAVKLAPDNPAYHDSRGLARALTDETTGAIADFQFFINRVTTTILNLSNIDPDTQISYQHLVEERKTWIQALQAGKNPFDEKTLHNIQDE